jgi:hypothetical protein
VVAIAHSDLAHTLPGMRKNTRALLCALTLLGCGSDPEKSPVDAGPDAEDSGPEHHYDAGICPVVEKQLTQKGVDQVDLLFMIDDSGSMREEQDNVAAQIPRLVEMLATGDLNGDGKQDFAPVQSLHLGVVSSDMGIFGVDNISTCEHKLGDDGLLRDQIQAGLTLSDGFSCSGANSLLPYQSYQAPSAESNRQENAQIAADRFACRALLGTKGCGLEQQLESMWKALAPSSNTDFVAGHGHGDAENKGFLRPDAVLAVVTVSDETDCSITEEGKLLFVNEADFSYQPSAANGNVAELTGQHEGLNFRCSDETHRGLLRTPGHYVAGLKSLKPDAPDRIIFTAITGVPEVAEEMMVGTGASAMQDFDGILGLKEMQVSPGTNVTTGKIDLAMLPRAACNSANGSATPGRRFVEVAKGFGQNGMVRSICKADFKSALDQVVLRVAAQLSGSCLPSTFDVTADGVIECDAIEVLPKGQTHCDASKGRVPHGTRTVRGTAGDEQRTACKINQVAVKDGKLVPGPHPLADVKSSVGWFYDSLSDDVKKDCPTGAQQRIAFTDGAEAQADSIIDLVCRDPRVKADPGACSF